MVTSPKEKSAIAGFAAHLTLLEYSIVNHFICHWKEIPLFMCEGQTHAVTDVCVVDQWLRPWDPSPCAMDKRHLEQVDPEPQFIAQAIATFQANNSHLQEFGEDPIHAKTIPGITMISSVPTFYKIPIMQDLVETIETGQYLENQMTVKLVPPVEDCAQLQQPLKNRAVILSCFEAFKQFL